MPPNNTMTEGEALAVEDDFLATLDWLWKQRGCNNEDPIYAAIGAFLPRIQALTAHTAASGGEVACWRMRRTNAVTGEWGHATSWQDGAPNDDDLSDAERVSPNGRMRYRIEYAYRAPPAAVPADALERLVASMESAWRPNCCCSDTAKSCADELSALIQKGADHGQR